MTERPDPAGAQPVRVGEADDAGAAGAVHRQRGDVPGHRTAVPDVYPVAVAGELDAEAVPAAPGVQVAEDHRSAHLLDGGGAEDGRIRVGQEGRPAGEVGDGGPELTGRRHRPAVGSWLLPQRVVPGVQHVAAGERFGGRVGGAAQSERLQDPLAHQLRPGRPGGPLQHPAEQPERQVGVVPVPVRRVRDLRGGEPGQQGGQVDALVAFPPRPVGFALQAAGVPEQLPQSDPPGRGGLGQVPTQLVVKRQLAGVAFLHDQYGGHRLGDRADAVLEIGVGGWLCAGGGQVGQRTVADHADDQRWGVAGALSVGHHSVDLPGGFGTQGHEVSLEVGGGRSEIMTVR